MAHESTFDEKNGIFHTLNNSIKDLIMLFQANNTIQSLSFIHKYNSELVKTMVRNMSIETFQAGDIIIKQHEAGTKFYFIMKGSAEVILEFEDYEYYDDNAIQNCFGEQKPKAREDKYKINDENNIDNQGTTTNPSVLKCKVIFILYIAQRNLNIHFDSLNCFIENRNIEEAPKTKYEVINELK